MIVPKPRSARVRTLQTFGLVVALLFGIFFWRVLLEVNLFALLNNLSGIIVLMVAMAFWFTIAYAKNRDQIFRNIRYWAILSILLLIAFTLPVAYSFSKIHPVDWTETVTSAFMSLELAVPIWILFIATLIYFSSQKWDIKLNDPWIRSALLSLGCISIVACFWPRAGIGPTTFINGDALLFILIVSGSCVFGTTWWICTRNSPSSRPFWHVRIDIATAGALGIPILLLMLGWQKIQEQAETVRKANLSVDQFTALAADPHLRWNGWLAEAIACNPHCPISVATSLHRWLPDPVVATCLAINPGASEQLLEVLAMHKSAYVRTSIARRSRLPAPIIAILEHDSDPEVRALLYKNPAVDNDTAFRLKTPDLSSETFFKRPVIEILDALYSGLRDNLLKLYCSQDTAIPVTAKSDWYEIHEWKPIKSSVVVLMQLDLVSPELPDGLILGVVKIAGNKSRAVARETIKPTVRTPFNQIRLDLANYRINPRETALGLRSHKNEVLLYRITNNTLQQIFRAQVEDYVDYSGTAHRDVLVMDSHSTDGFFDILQRNSWGELKTRFIWNGSRYEPARP
jgi:hypothetical protein